MAGSGRGVFDKGLLINYSLNEIICWPACNSLEKFITYLKGKLIAMQRLGVDLLESPSACNVLAGNIIRNKLYDIFLKEICRKTASTYPSITLI